MIWWFFDHSGKRLFSRSDATEFKHHVDSMSFEGTFPNSGNIPSAGDLIGWQDDDDLWEVHEVSGVTYDAFGDDFEIEGSSIMVTELGTLIANKYKVNNITAKKCLQDIINAQKLWKLGTLPAALEDDPLRKQRYRVTAKKLYMYTQMSAKSKCLSKYKRGSYMTPVEQVSDSWWLVQGTDGRVGYVPYPTRYLVRDGNAGDEDRTITCDEKFVSLWDLLMTVQEDAGWIVVPRVTVDDTGITGRYIDVRTSEPDFHGVRLSCSTNISDGTIKYDVSELYTALYGVGKDDLTFKDVTWTTAAGFPVNKPKGQMYVASEEALALYGHDGVHRFGVVNFDEETNASELLYKTYDALQVYSAPQITIEGTIADLYKLGYGGESMRLYDKVYCILNPIGRRLELRITKLTRDLVEPEKTKPTIGSIDNTDLVATTVKASAQSVGIKSWQLGSGSVGNDALNSGSVTADKIAAGAIVADAISAGAIVTEKLASGAVTADTIGAGAVTADKISSGAVDATKIAANTITSDQIATGTITSNEIAAGTITGNNIASQTITAINIAGKTITAEQIQAALITADCGLIEDGAIKTAQIADGSITAAKIVSLNADVIEAGTLKADRLLITGDDGVIYQINAAASGLSKTELAKDKYKEALNGTVIVAQSITAAQIAAATITGNEIAANTIKAANIDVATLFANETFTSSLYTSTIYGGKSIKIMVSDTAAAASAANKAQSTADSATSAASNAQTSADNAASAAATAQSTADDANTAASNAQTTADAASTAASNAQSTADTAKTNAAAAQSTADTAKTNAATAQTTADEAKALAFTASDTAPTSADEGYRWLDTGVTPQQMRTWRGLSATPSGATMTTDRSIDEMVEAASGATATFDNTNATITSDITITATATASETSWASTSKSSGNPNPVITGKDYAYIQQDDGTLVKALFPETIYGGTINADGTGTKTYGFVTLTGTEHWWKDSSYYCGTVITDSTLYAENPATAGAASGMCTHFGYVYSYNSPYVFISGSQMWIGATTAAKYATVADWKAYLAAQYAAGTPVQVAYKLKTAQTFTYTTQTEYTETITVNGEPTTVTLTNGTGSMTVDAEAISYTITADADIDVSYTCSGWETVNDTTATEDKLDDAYEAAVAARTGVERLDNYIEITGNGLNVKSESESGNYVNVNNDGVDIYVNHEKTSSFISNGLVLGNYILWHPEESGGLAFNLLNK